MANTYRWFIYEMETIPDYNGYKNFVSKIRWRYNALSYDNITADIEGISTFNELSSTYFEYNDLTQIQIEEWLESSNDIVLLQKKLDDIVDFKRNPPVVTLPLPW